MPWHVEVFVGCNAIDCRCLQFIAIPKWFCRVQCKTEPNNEPIDHLLLTCMRSNAYENTILAAALFVIFQNGDVQHFIVRMRLGCCIAFTHARGQWMVSNHKCPKSMPWHGCSLATNDYNRVHDTIRCITRFERWDTSTCRRNNWLNSNYFMDCFHWRVHAASIQVHFEN